MIDARLGHYRIVKKLGAGGMGEVYLAEDTRLGRQVALKLLLENVSAEESILGRFTREARALAALNHPNIVTVYSIEELDNRRCITMELVKGKTLAELIPDGGLSPDRFFELSIALADALAAAHQNGVTHRDLKPTNIMVTDEGRLKVLDFGLARLHMPAMPEESSRVLTTSLTQEGVLLGTIPYMSPEQARGQPADHRSDVFSLGIVLHQMATGRYPFRGTTTLEVISSILRDVAPPLTESRADLPSALTPILRRCLEKDPQNRFESAFELREALQEVRAEATDKGHVPGTARQDEERSWDQLLQFIEEGRVVPIIGQELLRVRMEGRDESLYAYLARRLADYLHVSANDLPEGGELNAVACRYIRGPGHRDVEDIYSALKIVLSEQADLPIPEPLSKLAEIEPLKLFVSTTFDGLMEQALNRTRFGGERKTQVLPYSPETVVDLPCEMSRLERPLVFHLLGRISAVPDYAVTDEDLLEFVHALQSKATRPETLFDELKRQQLLVIGSNFPDWLARFFFRTTAGARLSQARSKRFLVGTAVCADDELLNFMLNFSSKTIVFRSGDAAAFVEQLHARWTR